MPLTRLAVPVSRSAPVSTRARKLLYGGPQILPAWCCRQTSPGGYEGAGFSHRAAATLMLGSFVTHLWDSNRKRIWGNAGSILKPVFGPASMLFNERDLLDVISTPEYDAVVAAGKLEESLVERYQLVVVRTIRAFAWPALALGTTIVLWIVYAMVFAYR